MRRLWLSVFFLVLIAAGCGNDGADPAAAPPVNVAAPPANVDRNHEKILLDPVEPKAGQEIAATFAEANSRGGFFYLFQWNGSDWGPPVYQLESDANGDRPSAIRIAEGVGSEDYDVHGSGPDRLVLPDDLDDGYWRLCTASARDRACAPPIALGVDAG